jgi:hypothetical protein
MYTNKNKDQARLDRKQEIEASMLGIYIRNNFICNMTKRMEDWSLPIDRKSLDEIINHIAPFYITMTQYDYQQFKDAMKVINKTEGLSKEQKKVLKNLFTKFKLFAE